MIKKCKKCKNKFGTVDNRTMFCSRDCCVKFSNPLIGNEKDVISLYESGFSTIKIGKKFGCHPSTCERMLKKYNIKLRQKKYKVDDNYFGSIDSPDKAYWLGMIATDGNVAKNVNTISISLKDREHVDKFKKACKASYEVYFNDAVSTLQITSKKMKGDLIKLGITPNKSKTLCPAKLNRFEADFWRGCLDGDGGISQRGKYWRLYFCGTPQMVIGFLSFIEKNTGIVGNRFDISESFSRTQFGKFCELKKIVSLLYYNNEITCMDRKKRVADDLLGNKTGINEEYLYKKK